MKAAFLVKLKHAATNQQPCEGRAKRATEQRCNSSTMHGRSCIAKIKRRARAAKAISCCICNPSGCCL